MFMSDFQVAEDLPIEHAPPDTSNRRGSGFAGPPAVRP